MRLSSLSRKASSQKPGLDGRLEASYGGGGSSEVDSAADRIGDTSPAFAAVDAISGKILKARKAMRGWYRCIARRVCLF